MWAHGVLREGVRPLPWWWVVVSARRLPVRRGLSLSLYPGFGSFAGKLGWTSQGEQQRDTAANDAKLEARLAPWRDLSIEQLAANHEARSASAIASISTTAPPATARAGHGNHAVGAPDLTDADWLYGGDGETILTSILDGRNGMMPPLGRALGHNGTNAVAVLCS